MGIITTTVKWSVKAGLIGGPVYVAHNAGLFGSADQAQSGLKQIKSDVKDNVSTYVPKEVLENVPEVPKVDMKDYIPTIDISPDIRGLWNKGVLATFSGLANAPTSVKTYTNDVITYVQEQVNAEEKK